MLVAGTAITSIALECSTEVGSRDCSNGIENVLSKLMHGGTAQRASFGTLIA